MNLLLRGFKKDPKSATKNSGFDANSAVHAKKINKNRTSGAVW